MNIKHALAVLTVAGMATCAFSAQVVTVQSDLYRPLQNVNISITEDVSTTIEARWLYEGAEYDATGWTNWMAYGSGMGGATTTNIAPVTSLSTFVIDPPNIPTNGRYNFQIFAKNATTTQEWMRGNMTVRLNPSRSYQPTNWYSGAVTVADFNTFSNAIVARVVALETNTQSGGTSDHTALTNLNGNVAYQHISTAQVARIAAALTNESDAIALRAMTNLSYRAITNAPWLTAESDTQALAVVAALTNRVVYTNDARLTNARPPLAHTQAYSSITDAPPAGITDASSNGVAYFRVNKGWASDIAMATTTGTAYQSSMTRFTAPTLGVNNYTPPHLRLESRQLVGTPATMYGVYGMDVPDELFALGNYAMLWEIVKTTTPSTNSMMFDGSALSINGLDLATESYVTNAIAQGGGGTFDHAALTNLNGNVTYQHITTAQVAKVDAAITLADSTNATMNLLTNGAVNARFDSLFASGGSGTGEQAFATSGGTASGANSTAIAGGTASGANSTAIAGGTASGANSFAAGAGVAGGEYSVSLAGGNAYAENAVAICAATATGAYSVAIGQNAAAEHPYSFAFSDGSAVNSTTNNQFSSYFVNGYRFFGGAIEANGGGISNIPLSGVIGAISNIIVNGVTGSVANGMASITNLPTGSGGGITNVIATTNSAGVASITNSTMYVGTNVPAGSVDTNTIIAYAQEQATNAVNDAGRRFYVLESAPTVTVTRAMGNLIKLTQTSNVTLFQVDNAGWDTNTPISQVLYHNLNGFSFAWNTNVNQFSGNTVLVVPTSGMYRVRWDALPERNTNAANIGLRQ